MNTIIHKLTTVTTTCAFTALLGVFAFAAPACGGSGGDASFLAALGLGGALPEDAGFPASGATTDPANAPTPEGSDLFSISTNYSEAVDDPDTKADPLAAAGFVAPPQPNHYGSLGFSYPMDVPAGRAGMQPNVALSYSASSGDGWLGIGWNFGLGAISRSTEYGPPTYDHRDIFTYNGKRLIKVSGPANSADGVYRLEILSGAMLRFTLSDSTSGGVWRVRDSGGTETVYGADGESRISRPEDATQTYSWYYSRSTDRNGNDMQAVYDTSHYAEDRVLYLEEIRYTGNAAAGHAPRQYVRFHKRARGENYGEYVSKAPGFLMRMDQLLDRVTVGWTGGELWHYQLVYETSPESGRPLLSTVASDRTTSQPRFYYHNDDEGRQLVWQSVVNNSASDPETNPEVTRYFEGDFNGDGLSDMVFFNPETGNWKAAEGKRGGGFTYKIYGNRFRGYDSDERIHFFGSNLSGDFNGDGRADIAMYLPETREFWVAEHTGRVFQFRNYGRLFALEIDPTRAILFPGDYDGNGLSDALFFNEPTGDWLLALNKGGRFEYRIIAKQFQNLFRADYSPDATLNSRSTGDSQAAARGLVRFTNGDYNGDGRSDVAFYDQRDGHWWVGENHPDSQTVFRLHWKIYKKFTAPEQALFAHEQFSGDFNGDGFSDFLLFDREEGRWILGAVGDETIQFRVWSTAPQFKAITRWLQGDFNGDGRTDIGFYSATDNKFWIGEARANGFRYRIYSDMSFGPDPARVLATPLPEEEVELKNATRAFATAGDSKTLLLDYQYDGNARPERGEQVFAACFSVADCSANPELLIYARADRRLHFKQGAAYTPDVLTDLDLNGSDTRLLNGGRPAGYAASGRDGVLYYEKGSAGGSVVHRFRLLAHNGTAFADTNFAEFGSADITNFNAAESLYLSDHFANASAQSLLVLDDQHSIARFLHIQGTTKTPLAIGGALSAADFKNVFQNGSYTNRLKRNAFSVFSADFNGDGLAQPLLVDRQTGTHRYYLGTVDTMAGTITWTALSGNPKLELQTADFQIGENAAGLPFFTRPENGNTYSLVYASRSNSGALRFYRLQIGGSTISQTTHVAPTQYPGYAGESDHNGNPIVRGASGVVTFDLNQNRVLALTSTHVARSITRPDLLTKVYPFRWIQGDYNGDGLTDIGFFHLKEPTWYFAMSDGQLPDIIERVANGIGGNYRFEYAHSTEFDNTGDDDIPDLPTRSLVVTKITADDGFNNRIVTSYEYEGGNLHSQFINGRKEIDHFGFEKFTIRNALGGRTISKYHNREYSNYLENRALGGAVREVRVLGTDNILHSVTTNEYRIHRIQESTAVASFYAELSRSDHRVRGTLVTTSTSQMNFASGQYVLASQTNATTDHYSDAANSATTRTSSVNFETSALTNQRRPTTSRSLVGTPHEITTAYVYDLRGNVTRTTSTATGSGLPAVAAKIQEYDYDSYGNVTESRDVSSTPARIARTAYDTQLHQFVREERAVGPTLDIVTTHAINYGAAFGAPDSTTDPNNNQTFYDYDSHGRLVALRADTPNGTQTLAAYSYDTSFPFSAKTTLYSGNSDPDFVSRTYVDGLGRGVHSVKSASNGQYVRSGRTLYDGAGRPVQRGQTQWAGAGEIDTFIPHTILRNPTRFEYDGVGRVIRTTLPQAQGESSPTTISVVYSDPYQVVQHHSGGQSKRTISNGRGETLFVEDFGTGDGGQSVSARVGFCYNIAGQMIKKSDLNGGQTMSCSGAGGSTAPAKDLSGQNHAYWIYDAFGQMRAKSDPDFGVSSYVVNAFGDVTSMTDAATRTTSVTYDRLGRPDTKLLPNGEGLVAYTYDSYGGSQNAVGRLARLEDATQTKNFSYDELGRTSREIREIKNPGVVALDVPYTTEYRYDLLGRVKAIDYPEHPLANQKIRVCYDYGSAGYITGVAANTDAAGWPMFGGGCDSNRKDIVSNITYNEFGQTAGFALGNGVSTTYTHDVRGRIIRIRSEGQVSGATKTLQDAVYNFNPNNSIASVTNTATAYTTSYNYTYDGLNRLTNANGMYVEIDDGSGTANTTPQEYKLAYGYAANGNLIRKDTINPATDVLDDRWTYNYTNHAVTSIDSTATGAGRHDLTYDAVGNVTYQRDNVTGFEKEITFDSYNRIHTVRDVGRDLIVGTYRYDDGGFRVQKTANLLKGGQYKDVNILYPSMLFGLEHVPEDSTTSAINNIYLNGVRVAAMAENGALAYYLTDQVDSVSHVLDDAAETLTRIQYKPYGETFVHKGDQDFAPKYNSQELDPESKLYYYNARYYDPQIARFTSADTVLDGGAFSTQAWNRYMYVHGNPIRYKDPTGHIRFWERLNSDRFLDSDGVPTHVENEQKYVELESGKDDGTGLSALAERINDHEGVKNTKESVEATMGRLRELNGDRIGEGDTVPLDVPLQHSSKTKETKNFKQEKRTLAEYLGLGFLVTGGWGGWVDSFFGTDDVEESPSPEEPYNRRKHYGTTPKQSDRNVFEAGPDDVVDHDPPLVKRYYEGDSERGEKPGYLQTPEERKQSANDRSRMQLQNKTESHKQGGQMSDYSKKKKREHFGNSK